MDDGQSSKDEVRGQTVGIKILSCILIKAEMIVEFFLRNLEKKTQNKKHVIKQTPQSLLNI